MDFLQRIIHATYSLCKKKLNLWTYYFFFNFLGELLATFTVFLLLFSFSNFLGYTVPYISCLVFILCHAVRWIPNLWELKQSQENPDNKVGWEHQQSQVDPDNIVQKRASSLKRSCIIMSKYKKGVQLYFNLLNYVAVRENHNLSTCQQIKCQ